MTDFSLPKLVASAAPELTDAAADATTPTPEAANDNSPTESLPAPGSE